MSMKCECGCNTEIGSTEFQKIHVDFDELEKQEIMRDEHEENSASIFSNTSDRMQERYMDWLEDNR